MLHSNEDLFRSIAAAFFKREVGAVSAAEREKTKQLCYALCYGLGPEQLGGHLKISTPEARRLKEDFLRCFGGMGAPPWSTPRRERRLVTRAAVSRHARVHGEGQGARAEVRQGDDHRGAHPAARRHQLARLHRPRASRAPGERLSVAKALGHRRPAEQLSEAQLFRRSTRRSRAPRQTSPRRR